MVVILSFQSYNGLNIDRITLYNACDISSYINQYTYNLDHKVTGVANRIIKADGTLVNNAYSEGMTYDLAGNLLTMQRNEYSGLKGATHSGAKGATL